MNVYFNDLIEIYRSEVEELGRAGCRYLQFDEVPIAMMCDHDVRRQAASEGGEPTRLIDTYISLMQRILAGHPAEMKIAMHLCRGNFRGRWMAAGGYEPVAEKLFNLMPVDAFLLEYDSERAGGFEPLRFVPKDKRVVVGLVSSKAAALENQSNLLRRIEAASKFVLWISLRCRLNAGSRAFSRKTSNGQSSISWSAQRIRYGARLECSRSSRKPAIVASLSALFLATTGSTTWVTNDDPTEPFFRIGFGEESTSQLALPAPEPMMRRSA
jgi:hypothetical protein